MNVHMGGRVGPRVGSGRVRRFVGNRGSGWVNVLPGRVGSKKSDPWTTLYYLRRWLEFLYMNRDDVIDIDIYLFRCPVLLITGQKSVFNGTTRALHQAILKTCTDKAKVEFIEIVGVANILEEKVGGWLKTTVLDLLGELMV